MLQRLARFCYRRRRVVLVAWLLALVLVIVLAKTAGGKDATNFTLPGTESQQAFDLLKAHFPARSGDTADIVFAATDPRASGHLTSSPHGRPRSPRPKRRPRT